MSGYLLGYNDKLPENYPNMLQRYVTTTSHTIASSILPDGYLHFVFSGIHLDENMGEYLKNGNSSTKRPLLNSVGFALGSKIFMGLPSVPLVEIPQDEAEILAALKLGRDMTSKVIPLRIIGSRLLEVQNSNNPMIPRLAERADACNILERFASVRSMAYDRLISLLGTVTGACIIMRR